MSIVLDAVSSKTAATPTSITLAHTINNSNSILIVNLGWFDTSGKGDPTSITYNGVNLTQSVVDSMVNFRNQFWYLINPAGGTHNIVVTWSGSINDNANLLGISYKNTSQVSQPNITGHTETASGNSLSTTVVTTIDNCMLIDAYMDIDGAPVTYTPGTGQTQQVNQASVDPFLNVVSDKLVGAQGSYSMSYSDSDPAGRRLHLTLAITPSSNVVTRSQTDSVSVGASRVATIGRAFTGTRVLSDSILRGAGRAITVGLGLFRTLSDSIMNAAGRFAILAKNTVWNKLVSHAASWSKATGNSASWSKTNRSNTTWNKQNKNI